MLPIRYIFALFLFSASLSSNAQGTYTYSSRNRVDSTRQCEAKFKSGDRCTAKPLVDLKYCSFHRHYDEIRAFEKKQKAEYSKGRCKATTKAGTRCSRLARSKGYCWQHGG